MIGAAGARLAANGAASCFTAPIHQGRWRWGVEEVGIRWNMMENQGPLFGVVHGHPEKPLRSYN